MEASETAEPSTGWRIVAQDVNWEDQDMICVHCNKKIESAYGDDDEAT